MKTKLTIAIVGIASPVAASTYLLLKLGTSSLLATLIPIGIFITTILGGFFLEKTLKNHYNR